MYVHIYVYIFMIIYMIGCTALSTNSGIMRLF